MFTGIIEEIGTITDVSPIGGGVRIRMFASSSARELKVSDSVAINGACLTIIAKNPDEFDVEAVEETLKKTTLGSMALGDHCNLELPVRVHDRMGGHFVLGHVDTVGHILNIEERTGSWLFTIEVPGQYERYLIPVGSIAIDGVSLTIAEVKDNVIMISIIPYTMENTVFKFYQAGENVNVEFDMVGKYVEKLVTDRYGEPAVRKKLFGVEELRELGYD